MGHDMKNANNWKFSISTNQVLGYLVRGYVITVLFTFKKLNNKTDKKNI